MPSLLRRATCGWRRKVFHCPQLTPIFRNSRSLCIIHSQDSSLTPPKMRKVQVTKVAETQDMEPWNRRN